MFKPENNEYDKRLSNYIDLVPDEDVKLQLSSYTNYEFFKSISVEKQNFRYSEDKWNVKEILSHLIDCERLFSFRGLWIARNMLAEQLGYDENIAAKYSNVNEREYKDILDEYYFVRKSTELLYKSFNNDILLKTGKYAGKIVSVKALGFVILGHELHHINIIKQKYLEV
jgi:hypothetical protein